MGTVGLDESGVNHSEAQGDGARLDWGRDVRTYGYYREVFKGRRMPFAFVDLDLLDANIAQTVARAQGKKIRVASKSVRCVTLLRRIAGSDPAFRGFLCFTASEAVHLSRQGFDNLLLGYPIWHPEDMADVCKELKSKKRLICMVDAPGQIERLSQVAADTGVVAPVCIDLDMASDFPGLHFGVYRSTLATVEQVLTLVELVERLKGVRLEGLMGYEAQIAGVPDAMPGRLAMNLFVRALKRRSYREVAARRAAIVEVVRERGHDLAFVNGGGTGSLELTSSDSAVTEVTVGSGFYSPSLFDHFARFKYLPSAGYAIEITRRPGEGIYTCHGGGYVASGAPGKDKTPAPYLPRGSTLTSKEWAGEVQTPVRYSGPERLSLGDPIFMRHSKAGELCERFKTVILVSEGRIVSEVPTYRGEGECFL